MLVIFEQNCMVQTIPNFEVFWPKMVNNFRQSDEVILEDALWPEQSFNA